MPRFVVYGQLIKQVSLGEIEADTPGEAIALMQHRCRDVPAPMAVVCDSSQVDAYHAEPAGRPDVSSVGRR